MAAGSGVVKAHPSHAVAMHSLGFRTLDIEEWVGGVGGDVLPAVLQALEAPGGVNKTYLWRRVPVCMWGSYPINATGWGQLWFIATDLAMTKTISLHWMLPGELREMHERFDNILALTHPRNALHHKWLERHGFMRREGDIITMTGIPYHAYVHTKGH